MKMVYFAVVLSMTGAPLFAQGADVSQQGGQDMKPALLVIDIQNEFLQYVPEDEKNTALRFINGAIWLFRHHNLPVIRVYHTDPTYGPKPGDEAFEFPTSVIIKPDDPKIVKNYPSSFKDTELEKLVREKDCNTLFLCGLSAVGCVLATYYGAMERDFNVFMVKDALMSHNSRYTDFVEEIFDAVSYKTLEFMLEHMKK